MENEELYQELIDYIYWYCEKYKTADEKLAGKSVLYDTSNISETMRKMMIQRGWFSDEVYIKEMLKDGYENFKTRVAKRIFFEHKNELELNLCPECLKIARTPLAKQCRFCRHDWH
jgi:hypothetical protein